MPSTRPPFVLRIRREFVYSAVIVATLFSGAEIVLRVKDGLLTARRGARPYSIMNVTHDGRRYTDTDGKIVLENDPHLVYHVRGDQRSDVVTINHDGFRGGEWRREKAPDERRVIVLGGSTCFGLGASGDEKVFTAVLGRELDQRARALKLRAEVWNAGVIGYTSTEELVLLATRLVDFAPDVVVLFDGWNDFHGCGLGASPNSALLHPSFEKIDELLVRNEQPFFQALRGLMVFRSLESGTLRQIGQHSPRGEWNEYHDHLDLALPNYERNLRAMVRLARGFGAVPLLAPQPEVCLRRAPPVEEQKIRAGKEEEGYAPYARAAYPRFVATARAVAQAEQCEFVDGTTAFDAVTDVAFIDFCHLSDRGNELLAQQLLAPIARALRL